MNSRSLSDHRVVVTITALILSLKAKISKDSKLPVAYHYVNPEERFADLITKWLSYTKFLGKEILVTRTLVVNK